MNIYRNLKSPPKMVKAIRICNLKNTRNANIQENMALCVKKNKPMKSDL